MPMNADAWFREALRQKEEKSDGQHERHSDEIGALQRGGDTMQKDIFDTREMLRREMRTEYVSKNDLAAALLLIEERYKWFIWLVRAGVVGGLVGIGAKLMALVGLGK